MNLYRINNICYYKKGFTLLELIISLSILSFVIGTAYILINSSSRLVKRQVSNTNSQDDIRMAVEWITKDIKEGKEIICNSGQGDELYVVKKENNKIIKYKKKESGKISNENIYKIIRESDKDKFILVENICKDGFSIDKKDNLYNVSLIIKDKLNKDRYMKFNVSSRMNLAIVDKPDEGDSDNKDPTKPYIDIDNNGKFDGEDYNVDFINGIYHWKDDKKYEKGVLVFPSNFIVNGTTIICNCRDGIRIDENVILGTTNEGKINLITKNLIARKAIININGHGNKNEQINIQTTGVINVQYAKLIAYGQGSHKSKTSVNIKSQGSIDGSYCEITSNGGGGSFGNVQIYSSSSIMLGYSKIQCSSNGNGKSEVVINANGAINCSYSNVIANKNGNSNSYIKISSLGGTNASFATKEGNGMIIIK
ncbi:prepilin-type N-terminal cleavage/methylation domain-containing protein [Clostridium tetanomorphum]|uniref:Type II secretion system protein n=1 Tax=Clostridium tetanomorphum TaxID=1553 RepID=A0A923ECX7_CLOTT|nr:type II secretion system protein [Clostridium tetanomorphum]KAJ51626.1 hypothetical protein CTM_11825 [Clostridium tetanomorphum DSM 665]KAJ53633.1 hypothetical protein CTM_01594 [Clostridium tetanomorphum DSM 665]MBC2399636.1 type II secretion system protein [Clostridium tetanomorphum]MBP1866244.1 prepilin-type N-terminal cleavage/methylation domain-containing protein [Clostridium tetanomorphum]NRS86012.1 prepilin-type N-terminal cleavage/methylation domain-containing protein [Clostridium 